MAQIFSTSPKASFPFIDEAECISKQRSKKFYMSKDDNIKLIKNDKELQKQFPKNFATLPKEEICKILFKKG